MREVFKEKVKETWYILRDKGYFLLKEAIRSSVPIENVTDEAKPYKIAVIIVQEKNIPFINKNTIVVTKNVVC